MKLSHLVALSEDAQTLERLIRQFSLSAAMVSRLKATKALTINGIPAHTNAVCHAGDIVQIDLTAAEPAMTVKPENGQLTVIYEDTALLAVDKPAGMLSHPSRAEQEGTLLGIASGYLLRQEGSASCHILTRLDRDTSGLVLFAKNAYVCARMKAPLEKMYFAWVYGTVCPANGDIDAPIARVSPDGMARGILSTGSPALTRYETLQSVSIRGIPITQLRLYPKTGRTHQLRIHCAYIGHPLLGDRLYGNTLSISASHCLGIRGHCLRAIALTIFHPLTGERMTLAVSNHTNLPPRID